MATLALLTLAILLVLTPILLVGLCRRRATVELEAFHSLEELFQIRPIFQRQTHRYAGTSLLLQGKFYGKTFEIIRQNGRRRGRLLRWLTVEVRPPTSAFPKNLQIDLRRRTLLSSIWAILRGRRTLTGDRSIDRRLLYFCNDSILTRALLHFDELHQSMLVIGDRIPRRAQLRFKHGRLFYAEYGRLLKIGDGERLQQVLLFLNDLSDLILAQSWLELGTETKKHIQTAEENHKTQGTHVETHQTARNFQEEGIEPPCIFSGNPEDQEHGHHRHDDR